MSSLEQRLEAYIRSHRLLEAGDRVLLAVSGGVDSMVMSRLFRELPYRFAIGHVNFGLRGKESSLDAAFVREKSKRWKIPFHLLEADTRSYADLHRCSIQVAAREIRYAWLNKLAEEQGFSAIATAHHLDDSIETFFINLLRGSGIHGLGGIPVRNGKIIRPLLFADREMILQYATTKRMTWREDASNRKEDYLRNRIRHTLMPVLNRLQPSLHHVMERNMELIRFAEGVFGERMHEISGKLKSRRGDSVSIPIGALLESGQPELLLQELLLQEGVRIREPEKMLVRGRPGKVFDADGVTVTRDRDVLVLTPKKTTDFPPVDIHRSTERMKLSSGHVKFRVSAYRKNAEKALKPGELMVDAGLLQFPLELRKWVPGDRIRPLGMRHRKKVSDLLTDLKFSLVEKNDTCVLVDRGEIVCILGVRISETFKVSGSTRTVLKITLQK
ncbi:MAG: tRNA lysidine(34) synthetase TilS [Bacteroidota bacterium]|jgi:tRNA(Ile)-lysidine synthase